MSDNGAKLSLHDQGELQWYFSRGQIAFQRSPFGGTLERASLYNPWSVWEAMKKNGQDPEEIYPDGPITARPTAEVSVQLPDGTSQSLSAPGVEDRGQLVLPSTATSGLYTASETGNFTIQASLDGSKVIGLALIEVDKPWYQKWYIWLLIVLFLVGVGGYIFWRWWYYS